MREACGVVFAGSKSDISGHCFSGGRSLQMGGRKERKAQGSHLDPGIHQGISIWFPVIALLIKLWFLPPCVKFHISPACQGSWTSCISNNRTSSNFHFHSEMISLLLVLLFALCPRAFKEEWIHSSSLVSLHLMRWPILVCMVFLRCYALGGIVFSRSSAQKNLDIQTFCPLSSFSIFSSGSVHTKHSTKVWCPHFISVFIYTWLKDPRFRLEFNSEVEAS